MESGRVQDPGDRAKLDASGVCDGVDAVVSCTVGECRLTVSQPVLTSRMVSALETRMS